MNVDSIYGLIVVVFALGVGLGFVICNWYKRPTE